MIEERTLSTSQLSSRGVAGSNQSSLAFWLGACLCVYIPGRGCAGQSALPGHQIRLPTIEGRNPRPAPSLSSRSYFPTTRHGILGQNSRSAHGHAFGTTTTHAFLLYAEHNPFFLHSTCFADSTVPSPAAVLLCILSISQSAEVPNTTAVLNIQPRDPTWICHGLDPTIAAAKSGRP
jgi:hypothetical protein